MALHLHFGRLGSNPYRWRWRDSTGLMVLWNMRSTNSGRAMP